MCGPRPCENSPHCWFSLPLPAAGLSATKTRHPSAARQSRRFSMAVRRFPLNARPTHHWRMPTGANNTGFPTRHSGIRGRGLRIEPVQAVAGTYTLSKGKCLSGKPRNGEGKPVGGVYVEASPVRPNPAAKNPLVPNHVANLIRRTTMTAADGSIEFRPLPARKYQISPTDENWDPSTSDKSREQASGYRIRAESPTRERPTLVWRAASAPR
jgi:hypothetical protein